MLTVDLHFRANNLNKSLFGSSARGRKMWDMGASLAPSRVHQRKHHAKAKPNIQRLLPASFNLTCSQNPAIIMNSDYIMSCHCRMSTNTNKAVNKITKSANWYRVIDPLSQVSTEETSDKQFQSAAWPILFCMMWARQAAFHKLNLSSVNKQVCIYQHAHTSKHKQVGLFHLLHLFSCLEWRSIMFFIQH